MKELIKLAVELGQGHLLEGIETLSDEQKILFFQQLSSFANYVSLIKLVAHQKQTLSLEKAVSPPFVTSSPLLEQSGLEAISRGACACVILAGGMGTRLGFKGPKGLYPISPIKNKTLFQIHFEKIRALSDLVKKPLYVAVMVSCENKEETESYLQEKEFFGIDRSLVSIVCQEDKPFVSEKGLWILKAPGQLAVGPDGNGGVFHVLENAGVLKEWSEAHIEYVSMIQIDNPLADPIDLDLIGSCEMEKNDISLKVVNRGDPFESVGIIAQFDGQIKVAEYSDLNPESEVDTARFPFANTGIMCFSLPFILKTLSEHKRMPWHIAKKMADVWTERQLFHKESIYKYELFIFDLFVFTKRISVVSALREDCYSPLKERGGLKGADAVKRDLLFMYKKKFSSLTGRAAPLQDFELSAKFLYPSKQMKEFWKDRALPDSNYLE